MIMLSACIQNTGRALFVAVFLMGLGALETHGTEAYSFPHRLYQGRPLDERITIEVLQGIVNREAPRLFMTETWTPHNQLWTNVYTESYGFDFTEIEDCIPTLIKLFQDDLDGVVLYDPAIDGTRFVAATIGGLENLLPAAQGSAWLEAVDLPVRHDLSGRFANSLEVYEWALAEVLPRCNRTLAHAPASLRVDGKYIGWGFLGIDYVISERGFVFNLGILEEEMESFGRMIDATPEQAVMYRRILSELEQPALILGYGEEELEWFRLIGEYGHTYLHWGNNLSFHARVPARTEPSRQALHVTPDDVEVDTDRYYVVFLSSEGDTMKGPLPFFFGSWFDPARGSVPMNWGLHPEMIRFPAMLEYFYETATPHDYFYAAQVFNFEMQGLDRFAAHIRDLMHQADLHCVLTDFARPTPNPEGKDTFLRIVNPLGAVDALFEHSTQQGFNRWSATGVPVVGTSMHLTYWYRLLPGGWRAAWQDIYRDPVEREAIFRVMLDEIEKEAAAHEPPYVIAVYTDLHEFDRHCEMHAEVARRLDPDRFSVVRLDEAMSVLQRWKTTP